LTTSFAAGDAPFKKDFDVRDGTNFADRFLQQSRSAAGGVVIVASPEPSVQAETILVVEDEVLIRFELADYLRSCGYQVIEAVNATEAVSVLQTSRRINLVFSDVQLPGPMNGFGLARWIRANQPQVKVILSSGVARTASQGNFASTSDRWKQSPTTRNGFLSASE
jgi:CheY-like chemotaxis protein